MRRNVLKGISLVLSTTLLAGMLAGILIAHGARD